MSDHQVALNFEDGETRFITVADDQSIADAAYRQRINIPVDCNDGACGTCKAKWESGDYDPGTYVDDALSEQEAADGYLLACQAKPKQDMVVQIAMTSEAIKTQTQTYRATITEITRHSPKVIRFRLSIPNRGELAYLPGQYVNLAIPGTDETRSLSFANDAKTDELEFLVKIVPDGVMSMWLAERAKVGDSVDFTGPKGSFFLREDDRPVLMVAGGTGLAPMLAMLRTMRRLGSERPVHLVYGATEDADVCELDTLEDLASGLTNFTWDYVVADPNTKAKNQGFVMPFILPEHLHDGDVAVYLCGPPPMVEAVRKHLRDELAVEPAGFHYEKFTPNATSADKPGAPAEEVAPQERPSTPPRPATASVPPSRSKARRPLIVAGDEARGMLGVERFGRRDETPVPLAPTVPEDSSLRRKMLGVERFEQRDVESVGAPLDDAVACEAEPRPRFVTPGRFADKVVLVTGAAQGIGEAVAKRVSAEGGRLVLADRSELVEEVAGKLVGAGGDVVTQLADLETYAGAKAVVAKAVEAYGRVDIAIHVVGGTIWRQPFEHYAEEQIVAEINRSLYPTLWGARAVLPQMYAQGHGTIVNVSSTATMGLNRLPYAAAKGGVNALTRSLAFEAAEHGVRVVATAPGGTDAPPRRIPRGGEPENAEQEAWHRTTVEQTIESSLLKRYGTLDEQAAAICFVASDEGSYLTGQIVPVAGGDLG